jgi:ribonuclease HI
MKYYVVFKGRTPGIYQNWSECQEQVNLFKGAEHKSFDSKQAAEEAYYGSGYIADNDHRKDEQEGKPENTVLLNCFDYTIFCDGACRGNPGEAGSGLAIYQRNQLDSLIYGAYENYSTNNAAELHALHQSLLWARAYIQKGLTVQIYSDSAYAINAVTDWSFNWADKNWTNGNKAIANLELVQRCHTLFVSLEGRLAINHVKAHAGIEGNELADRMANYAIDSKVSSFAQFDESMSINDLLNMSKG